MTNESKLGANALKILDIIKKAGWEGKTCDEIEAETELPHQGASARINELWKKHNLIEPRGIQRKTRSGRGAMVYVQAGLVEADKRTPQK